MCSEGIVTVDDQSHPGNRDLQLGIFVRVDHVPGVVMRWLKQQFPQAGRQTFGFGMAKHFSGDPTIKINDPHPSGVRFCLHHRRRPTPNGRDGQRPRGKMVSPRRVDQG